MNANTIETIRKTLQQGGISFPVLGAILFGSQAAGEENDESDVDLLIMADGIQSKLHRRGDEIALIKKALPPIPLDIALYTENEIISNFRNHNPLFLDIAEEGKLLFDQSGLLENLMQETREYVRRTGIRKLDDGWMFPVRPGTARNR